MNDLTISDTVILVLAAMLVVRGVVVVNSITTTEVGLVLGLLGLIPANRFDRSRRRER